MDLNSLWRQRSQASRKEWMPHMPYVIGSGVLLFVMAVFILGSYYYAKFLEQMPESFPWAMVGALAIAAALWLSPVRTYIRGADLLFLLPQEKRMGAYFRKSLMTAMLYQSLFLLLPVQMVYWPLFSQARGEETPSFVLLFVLFALIKACNLLASWNEIRIQYPELRSLYRLIRGAGVLLAAYGLLRFPLPSSAALAGFIALAYGFALQLPSRYSVAWEELAKLELKHQSVIYSVLSWFVDIPQVGKQVKERRLAGRLADRLPFERSSTYPYLYLKTFLRTELFAMSLRILLVGALLALLFPTDAARSAIYALFVFAAGIQIRGLSQYHKHDVWSQIRPVPQGDRKRALLFLTVRIHAIWALILFALLPLYGVRLEWLAIALGAGIALVLIQHLRWKKRIKL